MLHLSVTDAVETNKLECCSVTHPKKEWCWVITLLDYVKLLMYISVHLQAGITAVWSNNWHSICTIYGLPFVNMSVQSSCS